MLLAILLALGIGLVLGLLGGGGSILAVPVLVYLLHVPPKEAIATSLVVVGATAAVAAIQHARAGRVRLKVGLIFSAAGMVGAALGGLAAAWFSGTVLLVLFAVMMVATGAAMLIGRKEKPDAPKKHHPAWMIVAEGLLVGAVTGLVGAGGGFLVVPALVLLGGLSMPEAVGTSLLVIALKSGAGLLGHITHVDIDWALAGSFTLATIVGSFFGTALASKLSGPALRKGFAVFVLLMAGVVLWEELGTHDVPETSALVVEDHP